MAVQVLTTTTTFSNINDFSSYGSSEDSPSEDDESVQSNDESIQSNDESIQFDSTPFIEDEMPSTSNSGDRGKLTKEHLETQKDEAYDSDDETTTDDEGENDEVHCFRRHIDMSSPVVKPVPSYDQLDNGSSKRAPATQAVPPPQETSEPEPEVPERADYRVYEERLRTFRVWPNTEVPSSCLAEAGFIYKGPNDYVICPFCNIVGYNWVLGDNPMADHRVWSPNCPFFSYIEHDDAGDNTVRSIDTCGLYGVEILPNSVLEDAESIERLGIQRNTGPQYIDKITVESRLATFQNWPKSMKQRPADLAEAGFFYTGVGDQTLCFHCGGGLKDWEQNDDPWEQHAMWFNKCVYLNLKKGMEFIKQVTRGENPPLALPGATAPTQAKEDEPTTAPKEDEDESPATEQPVCKICYKNELGVVFLPCGHIVACVDCAAALKNCAICRKPLEATVRAFLS